MNDDILNEAERFLRCKECEWYRNCLTPLRINTEDIQRQMSDASAMGMSMANNTMETDMIASMAAAAQNSIVEACPVLIDRLRNDQQLSARIKEFMRS
ncbi:MAG: hypothetical protein FWF37_04530 [Chloroflexi bacterium]|nr:hypothetical protein [Chloroflexota bacterium]